ncbi:MAG: hypothetical protein ACK5OB_19495 [Pirellula sp.]
MPPPANALLELLPGTTIKFKQTNDPGVYKYLSNSFEAKFVTGVTVDGDKVDYEVNVTVPGKTISNISYTVTYDSTTYKVSIGGISLESSSALMSTDIVSVTIDVRNKSPFPAMVEPIEFR